MTHELAVIGAGNMAEAIVRGVLRSGTLKADQIVAADVVLHRRDLFTRELGVRAFERNADAARGAKIVLLSVKPQQMMDALPPIAAVLDPSALIISIAAGISTGFIERTLGGPTPWRVVRTMPNTPMLVGEGMTAIARGAHATTADLGRARQLFESAGSVVDVAESQIDAVTAVSGSGPAYFFFLVEQMIAAGIELGLSPEVSHTLASKTALGAAKMLTTSTDSPAELRRKVTSPAGTTHAAITRMEAGGMGPLLRDALKAAAQRSAELGL